MAHGFSEAVFSEHLKIGSRRSSTKAWWEVLIDVYGLQGHCVWPRVLSLAWAHRQTCTLVLPYS